MKVTFDKAERREQKEILRGLYSDYNPVYHDAFVDRYNKDLDATALRTYMINRGIISKEFYSKGQPKGYHPGYDESAGCALYDLKVKETGEALNFSLYEWELK